MAITTAIRQWSSTLVDQLALTAGDIIRFVPGLIVAALAIIVAWVAGKILERLGVMGMEAINFDELLAGGSVKKEVLEAAGASGPPTRILGAILFWTTFFFLGLAPAADSLGIGAGRALVDRLIGFIPDVFSALLVVVAAVSLAGLLRETIRSTLAASNFPFARELGWLGYTIVVVFGLGMTLRVLNVGTTVITAVSAAVGGTVGLAVAIGFGVGARDTFGAIVAGRELRERLALGDEVAVDNYSGTVERLGLDVVELRTQAGLVAVPNSVFIQKAVVKKVEPPRRAA